jgi:hypothetical protein
VGLFIGLVWGIVVTRLALKKMYKGSRLALGPASGWHGALPPDLPDARCY